jgi:hypothetical protein
MKDNLGRFGRFVRNLRWYGEDIVTAVTGRARALHFNYGDEQSDTNPASGAPMMSSTRDVHGYYYGTLDRD